jgi:hypothetical protein
MPELDFGALPLVTTGLVLPHGSVHLEDAAVAQHCSGCGSLVGKDLNVRIHRCAHCKMEVHRDVNAAMNILKLAVAGRWSGFATQNNALAGGRRSGNLGENIAASRRQISN